MAYVLTHDEAKAFYDRFGSKQDLQRLYEDPAVEALLAHAGFESAEAVVELGCGTGRLAARLLRDELPRDATYVGLDVSSTMIALARERVAPWAARARVEQTDGSMLLGLPDASADRFLSTYVLDLLSEADIAAALREARRVLRPGGRLCVASLTVGHTAASRLVARLWRAAHALRPKLVGGCRPLLVAETLGPDWAIAHREVVCTLGLCSEIVVATAARDG